MDRDDPAYKGQRDYNRLLLSLYDPLVLGPIARFVWRCPTAGLVERYRRHIRGRHLDVGPGTGYFLERSGLADGSPVTIARPEPERPPTCLPAPASARHHGRRGGRPQTASRRRAVRLRRAPPGHPLPAGAARAQGDCGGQRRRRPRPGWRALRGLGPRGPGASGPRDRCSRRSIGRAGSTTSMTPRRGSARSSRRHSPGRARDGGLDRALRRRQSARPSLEA